MAVSPADFYAYSRATGVQIPDDPYEKAELVPEIRAISPKSTSRTTTRTI
jgi:hypothetical protein